MNRTIFTYGITVCMLSFERTNVFAIHRPEEREHLRSVSSYPDKRTKPCKALNDDAFGGPLTFFLARLLTLYNSYLSATVIQEISLRILQMAKIC